jgi:hypothetical protein
MMRKPFSKLLDWFYLHCADNHAVLQTKKGMIDVAVWLMCYALGDSLASTESTDAMRKQFFENLITVHKCTGANAVFYSAKYIGPILRQRLNLNDDPDFTEKEVYRRHNFDKSNIHRGGKRKVVKVKDGPLPASSANDTNASTPPIYGVQSPNPTVSKSNVSDTPQHQAATTRSAPTNRLATTNSRLPNPSSAVASPSTQTVSTTVTTPPIWNSSKQDIAQSSSLTKVITKIHAPD